MREVLSSTDQPALEEHFEREERNRRHEFGREIRRQGIKKDKEKAFQVRKTYGASLQRQRAYRFSF